MIIRFMIVVALFIFVPVSVRAAELTDEQKEVVSQKITSAVDAAKSWLAIIDNGKYQDSWENSAQFFKDKVPDSQWETTLRQVREPLGPLVSRDVANVQYLTYLPGAPKGEYVVIQFKTNFSKKPQSIETVTPMLESDGTWKVSGYYIK